MDAPSRCDSSGKRFGRTRDARPLLPIDRAPIVHRITQLSAELRMAELCSADEGFPIRRRLKRQLRMLALILWRDNQRQYHRNDLSDPRDTC
jgi:hypothetical protein